jgi:hypothetical protein
MERGLHTQLDPTFPEGGPTPWLTLPRALAGGIGGGGGVKNRFFFVVVLLFFCFFFGFFLGKKRKKKQKKSKKNAKKSKKKSKQKRKKSDLGGPPLPDEGVPPSFQPPSPLSRMEQPNLQSFPQT